MLEQPANILEDQHFIRTLPRLLDILPFILENFIEMRLCSNQIKNTQQINTPVYPSGILKTTVCGRIVESFDKALQTVVLNCLPVLLLA